MNQNHQIILSTCYVKIEIGFDYPLVYFIPQEDNSNGVDFIISYRFFQTEFLKIFKLSPSQTNDNQYVFQGFKKGIFLEKINQIPATSYKQIFEQLLEIILICHQNHILARCLTIENIYINLENYQIYLLEFGFLPRLPSFIEKCHINTDILVIQEIMKFLDLKVNKQTEETRCIQEKLAQQNLDYYKLFDLQILNQELKNKGRVFYGQQFQNFVPQIELKIDHYDNQPLINFYDLDTTPNISNIDYKISIQILLDFLIITVCSIQKDVNFKQVMIFIVSKIIKQFQQDLLQSREPQFFIHDTDWSKWKTVSLTKIQNQILETLAELRKVENDIKCDLKSYKIDSSKDQYNPESLINNLKKDLKQSINNQEQRLGLSLLFCIKLFYYQYQQIEDQFCLILKCRQGIQSILNEIKYGQHVNTIKKILRI